MVVHLGIPLDVPLVVPLVLPLVVHLVIPLVAHLVGRVNAPPPSLLPRHACPGWSDDQLSSLDLVAENEQQAKTLVGLLNRLVVQCQDEKTVRK